MDWWCVKSVAEPAIYLLQIISLRIISQLYVWC